MANSGWDIAVRRIDAEFDLPQFIASSLGRKIAANNFRLPTSDRGKFQPIPDDVIACIEQIVRDAYLDAGEDVGGESLRERRSGVTVDEVARLLFVSRAHVLRLLQHGDLRGSVGKDDETVIDEDSARTYKAERDAARKQYFRTQTEDDDPPGI